jgi:hypothetical protein
MCDDTDSETCDSEGGGDMNTCDCADNMGSYSICKECDKYSCSACTRSLWLLCKEHDHWTCKDNEYSVYCADCVSKCTTICSMCNFQNYDHACLVYLCPKCEQYFCTKCRNYKFINSAKHCDDCEFIIRRENQGLSAYHN